MDPSQRPSPPAATRQQSMSAAAKHGLFPTDSDTHLLDRLNAIYKYRYVSVTIFLLVLLGVTIRTYTTTPMYRATTSVLIEEDRTATVAGFNTQSPNDYSQDPEPYYQTQLRILTGRELSTRVVQKLRLENVPEYNGQGPRRTGLAAVLDTMVEQGKALVRQLTGKAAPERTPAAKLSTTDLANAFLGSVHVEQVRGSRLFNVSITSSDPQFAGRAADMLATEYVQFNLEYRTDATRKSLDFLAGEIAKQQKKVEDSERA